MRKLVLVLLLTTQIIFANDLINLRTSSQKLNNFSLQFYKSIQTDFNKNTPLHGRQLRLMHEIVFHYIDFDKQFLKLIGSEKNLEKQVLLSLDRYQSFLANFEYIYSTSQLRRYINDEDLSFNIKRNELHKHIMTLLAPNSIKTLVTKINIILNTPSNDNYSKQIISHKALAFVLDTKKIMDKYSLYKKYEQEDLKYDRIVDLTDKISGRFGNTAGSIRWRKGHLLKNKKIHNEIASQLKPLDIITEKTYFALTDKFIPGHFGHNAIWLGTKDELIRLGLWSHKSIIPFHKEIEAGKSILEVDRTGTHLKSLEVFMNVDEFAILRLKEINFTTERLEEIYTVALSQMGKIYDFNFDVETTDKLVCSELLYQSFTNIHWPTQSYLTKTKFSRTTISPDNVVSLALYNDAPIELIYYVAQRKKNQRPYYKNLDQLADDLNFIKINNEYKRIVKKCKLVELEKKECDTIYENLAYSSHPHIDGIGF